MIRRRAWVWYLAATGALTGLYLFAPPLAGNGPLINGLGLSGVVAIVVGIRMHRPKARAAWWLFAGGQFLFVSGDLYTYSYPKVFGADVGFPSIGDGPEYRYGGAAVFSRRLRWVGQATNAARDEYDFEKPETRTTFS